MPASRLRPLVGLLVVAAVAGPADALPPPTDGPAYPPFDLTYLPGAGLQGVAGVRPAAVARHAGNLDLGDAPKQFVGMFLQVLADADLDAADPPAVADIAQVICGFQLHVTTPTADAQGTLLAGGCTPLTVTTTTPFDWPGRVKAWFPTSRKATYAGQTYRRLFPKDAPAGCQPLAFYAPDDRTVVVADEESVKELIDRLNDRRPAPAPPPGWDAVSRCLVAVAFDNRHYPAVVGCWPAGRPELKPFRALVEGADAIAVGLTVGPISRLTAVATSRTPRQAKAVARAARQVLLMAHGFPLKDITGVPDGLLTLAGDLRASAAVTTDGCTAGLTATGTGNLVKLVASAFGPVD